MKKMLTGIVFLLASLPCFAQFIGYVAPQTETQVLANGVACTGANQVFPVNNLGQVQHYASISSVGSTILAMQIQGVDAKGHVFAISDTAQQPGFGGPNNVTVQGSGYYPIIQIQVSCLPSGGSATFTLSYSGAWGAYGPTVGSSLTAQVDKLVFNNVAGNANANASYQTPFASSAGAFIAQYNGGSAAGGTVNIQCSSTGGSFTTLETFTLANTSLQQFFVVPAFSCGTAKIIYNNSGATGTVLLDYVYAQSGPVVSAPPGYLYANITTNASTVIKTAPGFLHSITVNSIGTTETLAIFDNTTCTGTTIGTTGTLTAQQTLIFDVNYFTGLCITSAGTTTGNWTVSYQ